MLNYTMPIVIEKLEKKYYPEKIVLEDINLTVVEGETIAILGNNGAGKTTLLRILATLLLPSSGLIEIFGLVPQIESNEIKKLIGYLPERFSFYPYFSVNEILDYFEQFNPNNRTDKDELREQVINLLEIESYLNNRIGTLSKGMLHKVGLAITLMHDPPLLLLDEPTSGLDPLVRTQVRKILLNISDDFEKTIVISSHILEDVEAICDRVFFIEKGKMLADPFWISDLKQKFAKLQRLVIKGENLGSLLNELKELDKIIHYEISPKILELYCIKDDTKMINKYFEDLLKRKINVTSYPITLEGIYILNHANISWLDYFS